MFVSGRPIAALTMTLPHGLTVPDRLHVVQRRSLLAEMARCLVDHERFSRTDCSSQVEIVIWINHKSNQK